MRQKVLIGVGNIYLDNNIFGVNSSDHQLVAGKEYQAEKSELVLGGSAVNFLLQAKKLGHTVAFLGKVGGDESGKEIRRLLQEEGILPDLVTISQTEQTSISYNFVLAGSGEFIGINTGRASMSLSPEDLNLHGELASNAVAIYFGGSAKQEKIFSVYPTLLKNLQDQGIFVCADPNRFPNGHDKGKSREIMLKSFPYIDIYLPNESELLEATGKEMVDEALEETIKLGAKMVVVKQGELGCRIKTNTEDIHVQGFAVSVLTTVGAGDCFNAGFITQYLKGKQLSECGRFANAVAAIKVSQNKMPEILEVEKFLAKR